LFSGGAARQNGARLQSAHFSFYPPSKSGLSERHCVAGAFRPAAMKETVMQYLLMIYQNEAKMLAASQETVSQTMAAYGAYTEAIKKAGVYLGGNRLKPTASASNVRVTDGKTNVLDGPYAETKEQLGGYYLIDVPDLDAALSWAARCPGASRGTMEVRPIWPV
jgi:hypothetical protein